MDSVLHNEQVAKVHVLRLQMSRIVLALTAYRFAIKLLFPFSSRDELKQDPKLTGL
jgi:hypothetical protein